MKNQSLKTTLIATYVILIILLLLSLVKCNNTPTSGGDTDEMEESDVELPPIKETFEAEVVMCIDCTGSMESILNTVKSNALSFYPDMKKKCLEYGKEITSMRIKVIGFRDIEDSAPFEISSVFNMPDESRSFKSFVSGLKADGGGDNPERGYDALALAMSSDWTRGDNIHQVIILWTDAASHPLAAVVPSISTFDALADKWNNKMSSRGKRLILFAPADDSWDAITRSLSNSVRHDVNFGAGLSDLDYDTILKALSESI